MPSVNHIQYLKKIKSEQKRIRFAQFTIIVFLLILWEAGTRLGFIDGFIFSSPSGILLTIAEMSADFTLFYHLGITLSETLVSFVIIIVIALLAAGLLWWFPKLAKISAPYLVVLNSLPKTALAPVFIVWLGSNMKTIIVAAVSVAVFGSIVTLYNAFNEIDPEKLKLIQTLGGSKKDALFKAIIPANLPVILSLMKVNIGLSLVGVIIAEFIAAKAGLGYLIIYASQVFKLDIVMMSIVLLCILAAILYRLLTLIEARLMAR